jgi:hypothetical protein
MIDYGTRLAGFNQKLVENEPLKTGKVYQIDMKASSGILDCEGVTNYLLGKLYERYPELQVKWINVSPTKQTIMLQFLVVPRETLGLTPRTQSISSAALMVWLPGILSLIGIGLVFIGIFTIIGAVPTWAWATIAVGAILFFFGSGIAEKIIRLS